jgi:hypothetical protein
MGFLTQKKDDKKRKANENGKQPAKKWWGKLVGKDGPEPQSSVRFELPASESTRRRERERIAAMDGSGSHRPAPRHSSGQRQESAASPALSRTSSLSEEDVQYLATQAGSSTPRSRPDFDRDAWAGAFEPARHGQRPQTKYPVPPLTKEQLNALAGAYAPPAPPPRRPDKLDYR